MAKILTGQGDQISPITKDLSAGNAVKKSGVSALKAKRSAEYIKFFTSIDHKKLTATEGWPALMDRVHEEFGSAGLLSLPLGIVSKCFLGHPYEVHIIDISGAQIINHYKAGEPMPSDFEKARKLAVHNAYVMIEVYSDKMLLIRDDGSVTQL